MSLFNYKKSRLDKLPNGSYYSTSSILNYQLLH